MDASRPANLRSLPQRTYRFRILGMGLAALPLAIVFRENHAPWPYWAWLACTCLLWPHLAYQLARRSRDPFDAERRNFMIDSIFAGSWAPLLQFNLLPSVLLLTVATADKVNSGVRDLWLRSLPGMAAAIAGIGMLTGFAAQVQTSMAVLVACLPILVIHTLAVSLGSYRLVRRVQGQNQKLEQLSRADALTGLANRRHWQLQAEALLQELQRDGGSASLLLLDVDRFKDINDRYGHAVGDDVLCGIAAVIGRLMHVGGHAGRLGGDEFVIVLATDLGQATADAERLRAAVELLEFPNHHGLRCSVSIGLASAPAGDLGLREWIEAADRALYRAKRAGRNRSAGSDLASEMGG